MFTLKNRLHLVTSLLVAIMVFCGLIGQPAAPAGAQASSDHLTVVFIVDVSGSMKENDNQDLRLTAMKLFITLLDDGDGAAIITFSSGSEIKSHFTPINGRADKLGLISALNGVQAEGYTDIKASFEAARQVLAEDTTSNQKIILFLTDGNAEMPGGLPGGYEEDVLALVKSLDVPVIAIGLTPASQSPLLGRIPGAGASGSRVIPARTASDLLDVYLQILGQLKDRTILGSGSIAAPSEALLPLDPALAQYVDSISFVAVKPGSSRTLLISPDGQPLNITDPLFSETFVDVDPNFAVYTIPAPVGGDWRLAFEGSGAGLPRAILRSKLRVSVLQPAGYTPQGQPMTIVANLTVLDPPNPPQVSIGSVTFSATVETPEGKKEVLDLLYDDGTHADAKAGDGQFTNQYVSTDLPGTYRITIKGNKGIVPVTGQAQTEVVAFPQIQFDEPGAAALNLKGPMHIAAHLQGGEPPILDQGSLILKITGPDGRQEDLIQMNTENGQYSADYAPKVDGLYHLEITADQATYHAVPYAPAAARDITVMVVPTITFSPVDPQGINLGQLLNLEDGLGVIIQGTSTSSLTESIQVTFSGIPGVEISPSEVTLDPKSSQKFTFTIRSSSQLAPGPYVGKILFAPRSGVEVVGGEQEVRAEIASVLIKLTPAEIKLNSILQLGKETVVSLQAESNSPFQHPLQVEFVEPDGFRVVVDPENIQPNEKTSVSLRLTSEEELTPGDYTVRVKFTSPGAVVSLTPETVVIQMHIPSLLERFGLIGGSLLAVLLTVLVVIYVAIPGPSGQLIPVIIPVGGQRRTYSLGSMITLLKGYNKKVTAGPSGDIRLAKAPPASFFAERREVSETLGTLPRKRVIKVRKVVTLIKSTAKGGVSVNDALVPSTGKTLKRGDLVKIGEYTFKYQ